MPGITVCRVDWIGALTGLAFLIALACLVLLVTLTGLILLRVFEFHVIGLGDRTLSRLILRFVPIGLLVLIAGLALL
ncbi:MAG: hypothetical protein ACK5NY_09770 [Burkholderiaceae bacterium]